MRCKAFEPLRFPAQIGDTAFLRVNMIHTLTIRYLLSADDFDYLIPDIEHSPHFNKAALNSFLGNKKFRAYNESSSSETYTEEWLTFAMSSGIIGIEHMKFIKMAQYPNNIFLDIMIDIESLIEGRRTINLFRPNYYGTKAACMAYASAILTIFPSLNDIALYNLMDFDKNTVNMGLTVLPYLSHGKVVRLEYSNNLYTDNKELALELINNSVRPTAFWQKDFANNDNTHLIRGQKKKKPTAIFKVYDKELELVDKNKLNNTLLEEAENIIRSEYGRNSFDKDWVMRNYNLPADIMNTAFIRSPLLCFDCQHCTEIFMKAYAAQIGLGDWYSKKEFSKIIPAIDSDIIGPQQKKTILRDLAPVVSQARSIKAGYEKYQQSDGYHLAKTTRSPNGTDKTFKNYLRLMDNADIQLLRIPDRRHIDYLQNPIKNIVEAPWINRVGDYALCDSAKNNIITILNYIWQACDRVNPTKKKFEEILNDISIYSITSR